MAIKSIYKLEDERISSDSIVHQLEDDTYKNLKEYLNNSKIKTAQVNFTITPSTKRGNSGYGATTLDISNLNASKILSISFSGTNTSNFMLFGCTTDLIDNPKSLNLFGYRIAGAYSGTIAGVIYISYL